MNLNSEKDVLLNLIKIAIEEDIKSGDVTSEAIFDGSEISNAYIVSKADGIFCGSDMIDYVYELIDSSVKIDHSVKDGSKIVNKDIVANISGSTKSILLGERILLNFIQRMSGIATKSNNMMKLVEGTEIKILDTRKTLPGFRTLDKYSVKTGGAVNHRIGLFDMVMIKDNHIKAAGSIANAVAKVRAKWNDKYKIEVETTSLEEVKEALDSNADIIMLDNMDKSTMSQAIEIINGKSQIELSGNMDDEKIMNLRDLKIDFISIGVLTHSVEAFDLSMKFK